MGTQLGEAFVPIRATLDKLDQDLANAKKKINGTMNGIAAGVTTAFANKGIEVMEGALQKTWETMAEGVEKAADLEAQMDAIGAISGATEEQVAGLKKTAMDLGIDPKLKVSAHEAAIAIEELAAAGVDVEDIMNGAAKGAVQLQNATGGDWAQSAAIAADSMAIFKIRAEDMAEATNQITAVTVASKFDVNDYALALAQAGGVAAASGVEFDDFNTTITAISPLFASGSDAGTSYKVMLQRLVPASKEAKGAMEELGLITEEEGNRFFDAQGNLKSGAEIAGLVEEAFSGLSEAQRNQAMSTIFGTDAMRAAVGLMETGKQGFLDLEATMADTSAADAAAQRMTNLSGATEILKGVVEGLQIQYGERLLPKLTELAQKATDFASTEGPALVESLANLTLGAIDFGESATPGLSKGLEIITGLGESTGKLVESGTKLAEAFGLVSEKAEEVDGVMLLVNAVVDAAMAPYEGLRSLAEGLATAFSGWAVAVRDAKGWISDLSNSMSGLDANLPDWLRPGSPPPLEIGLRGIGNALKQMPDFSSRFEMGGPSFPALAGAGIGGGGNTTNIYIDGIQALTTSGGGGDPLDEALLAAFELLRQRLRGKR